MPVYSIVGHPNLTQYVVAPQAVPQQYQQVGGAQGNHPQQSRQDWGDAHGNHPRQQPSRNPGGAGGGHHRRQNPRRNPDGARGNHRPPIEEDDEDEDEDPDLYYRDRCMERRGRQPQALNEPIARWDPKLSKYSGSIPWRAYEVKLSLMAQKYQWDDETKLA